MSTVFDNLSVNFKFFFLATDIYMIAPKNLCCKCAVFGKLVLFIALFVNFREPIAARDKREASNAPSSVFIY